jgi:hypothetical protein
VRRELQLIIGSYKNKTRENIGTYLNSFRKSIETGLMEEYQIAFAGWKGNLYQITRRYEEWLKQTLQSELKEILLNEEKSFELLNHVKKHLSFHLKSFRERLRDNLARVLGIQMQSEQWEITVGAFKKPDVSISRSFDSHLDMFWFLFPMFLFRSVFRRYFASQIHYEIEKNLHRLTSGLTERINKEMDNLMGQALAYMNEELNLIDRLLSENQGNSEDILQRMNSLKSVFQAYET